jgi:hypothetical protein
MRVGKRLINFKKYRFKFRANLLKKHKYCLTLR